MVLAVLADVIRITRLCEVPHEFSLFSQREGIRVSAGRFLLSHIFKLCLLSQIFIFMNQRNHQALPPSPFAKRAREPLQTEEIKGVNEKTLQGKINA